MHDASFNLLQTTLNNRSFGWGLAGLGASFATSMTRTMDVRTQAIAAGMGALTGGFIGDSLHTKQSTEAKLVTNAMVGAVAVGASLALSPIISKGTLTLMDHTSRFPNTAGARTVEHLFKLKTTNKLFDRIVSRAGAKSLMLGLGIPIAHKHIQRLVSETNRKAEIAMSSIDNSLKDIAPKRREEASSEPPPRPGILRFFGTKEV